MENVIIAAIFSLIGIIIGIIFNELLRRKNRIEVFSSVVFERRLSIYEQLYTKVQEGQSIINDIISNPSYSKEECVDIISNTILDLAAFSDKNGFYIDRDLAAHCTALWMGLEDICPISDDNERNQLIHEYTEKYKNTIRMIEEEAGINQLKNLFKSINKPKFNSPTIDRINELRKEMREQK